MAKKMGKPPVYADPGWLNPASKDKAVRFNPPGGRGGGVPTFNPGHRFGSVEVKDPAVRFNPKKP